MSQQLATIRYRRLELVLCALLTQPKFSLVQLKATLPQEKPAFVTRVVHQLEREGHLLQGENGTFSWVKPSADFPVRAWLDRQVTGPQLRETPVADRPRERLLAQGAASLRIAELLAILIRSGRTGESALQAGEKIAARYGEVLERLAEAGRGELKAVSAVLGETAYCQIMAGIELGRRIAKAQTERQEHCRRLQSSADALAFCREHFSRLASDGVQEEFHVVCLDSKNQVVGSHRISVGILDRSLIHPREVFRPAIKDAAKAVLLVHNHPSGDPSPSEDDLSLTARLEEAGKTLGIGVLDHVIVARTGAVSIREFRSVS